MAAPNNEPTEKKSGDNELEKTVILLRCAKHNLVYMENEGCPECKKEKGESGDSNN